MCIRSSIGEAGRTGARMVLAWPSEALSVKGTFASYPSCPTNGAVFVGRCLGIRLLPAYRRVNA